MAEPEKTSTGIESIQDTTTLATATATSPTSISPTTTAPEPEPGQTPLKPTPTVPSTGANEETSSPPPPQPQAFPTPYSHPAPSHATAPTWPGANTWQAPTAPIPPPPKASETHLQRSSITSTNSTTSSAANTHAHVGQYNPSHPHGPDEPAHPNLEHPPGYQQNPVIAQPSAATLGGDGGSHFGVRQVWDPAPGEAGGRYVYDYTSSDFFDGQDDDDGWGNVRRKGGEEDWVWDSAAGAWNVTLSWMKSAGEKMAEAEEGVWRWVNGRS
ncbi:uncharacterized protein GIQ15_01150 [Arthroderma uncinatum]|uniref:uncharacterized protein n=1 Tax=Arthroderma uncinatum TaxID=74035 RepID=UPI00144A5DC5|nr:uncharacterized protein GIQ15_01150 [Arthroderma uncinatum]KAF3491633.1 hypothetical protein GIQ15_01150 [Arthroderma uncinatum]